MVRIDSTKSPRILAARRLVDRGERMLLEGERSIREALEAGVRPELALHVAESDPELLHLLSRAGTELLAVSPRVLAHVSELSSARSIVALAAFPAVPLADLTLENGRLALILDGVQDPTNVGAILRSAEALGAGPVLTLLGCSSPFSPRALRASAGSALRVKVAPGVSAGKAVELARREAALLVGAAAHGGAAPELVPRDRKALLVIGSEGRGLSAELEAALDRRVTIPLRGRVESLNAAVAAALLIRELSPR